MDALEQVRHLVRRQVPESRHDAGRHDEYICESRIASGYVQSAAECVPHTVPLLGEEEREGEGLTTRHDRLEVDERE